MNKAYAMTGIVIILLIWSISFVSAGGCNMSLKVVTTDKKTLTVGETWSICCGYSITANFIDAKANPKQAGIILFKDGVKKDEKVVYDHTFYEYKEHTYCGEIDVLMLSSFVDSIFSGATSDMIQLQNASVIEAEVESCTSNWQCSAWSICADGYQTRTCTDLNHCSTQTNKPAEKQQCASCTENWACASWSSCAEGLQKRTCTDSNNCGTEANKPSEKQNCSASNVPCTENWQCEDWTSCINGQKTRTCKDTNNCGTTINKPTLIKNCIQANETQEETEEKDKKKEESEEKQIDMYIQNEKIIIEKTSEGMSIIKMDDKDVKTSLKIIKDSSKIFVETSKDKKEIRVLPEGPISKSGKIDNVNKILIDEYGEKAVYLISGTKKAKLLFVFPVLIKVEIKVDVETGDILSIKKPWWAFLARI